MDVSLPPRGGMTLTGQVVAPEVEVKEIHFNHQVGRNASDAIDLVAVAGADNPSTVVPEYVAGRKDNYPVAYVPNVKPSIKAVFAVRPGFIPSLTVSSPAPVEGNAGNPYQILEGLPEVAAERGAGGQNSSGDAATFTALLQNERETPRVIGNHTVALRWRVESMANVKFTGGYWEYFAETTQNNVYTLLDAPKMPWMDGAGHGESYPWFGALEFVIGPAKNGITCGAAGVADAHEAMRKITEYLFDGHGVKYETYSTLAIYSSVVGSGHFGRIVAFDFDNYINKKMSTSVLEYLEQKNENPTNYINSVNCYDQAGALHCASRLLGVPSVFRYIDPFGKLNVTKLVGYPDVPCNNPKFRGNTDNAYNGDNPGYFNNHAVCVYDDLVFDACMGPFPGIPYTMYLEKTIYNLSQLKEIGEEPKFTDSVCEKAFDYE